jgi:DNA polymerase-3 subunit delta'
MALKNIIGQGRALRILLGTLKRGRVPSSAILSGDTGIGKRLTAVNYAKAINCLEPADLDCCDMCISCKKIDSETHPDVMTIVPENGEIRIEAVRKVEETLSLKPHEGRKKIVIIDDAETMNIYAANAFLKTLEEPPPDSLILLISSNPDRLPDTIRSRCMNIKFYPLPLEECKNLILKNAGSGVRNAISANEDINLMLTLSMGRPGLAVSKDLKKEREWFIGLLNNMLYGESEGGIVRGTQSASRSRDIWADKSEIKLWLDMAFILLRDIAVCKITEKKSDLILGSRQWAAGNEQKIKNILDAYQDMQRIRGLLDFNLNKSITWNYVASIMKKAIGYRQ